jgi:hypothetical protein
MIDLISIALCFGVLASPPSPAGVIEGVVVNGSDHRSPVAGATVVLRAEHQGALISIGQTTTDNEGGFRFETPAAAQQMVFLPGANYQGIHYPGSRIRLQGEPSAANRQIVVYETIDQPNPLVASRHDIEIHVDAGALVVTESMVVANRTLRSYVGPGNVNTESGNEQSTVTLRLSIPPEFDKVTFAKEFFGRQFQLNGQSLETQIPWTPGSRELKFTYRLPVDRRDYRFRRVLDLPTERVRVTVSGDANDGTTCTLSEAELLYDGAKLFESNGRILPAGDAIELQLGRLPVLWTSYAGWVALAVLLLLVLATSVTVLRRLRSSEAVQAAVPTKRQRRNAA